MKKFHKKFRYISEYIILYGLLKLLKILPLNFSAKSCGYIARFIGPLLPVTKIAKSNIRKVYTTKTNAEIHQIIKDTWYNFGQFIGEFPHIKSMPNSELLERIEIIGKEHIQKFIDNNQPYILFSGHFANWEIFTRILNQFYSKFVVIYRPANNKYVNNLINYHRKDDKIIFIPKGIIGAKKLLSYIKQKYAIAILADQNMTEGIVTPFLNQDSRTSNAIAKFALQYDYPIVPLQMIRLDNKKFRFIINPPVEFQKIENSEQNIYDITYKVNQYLEKWVYEYPSQWLWFHDRWKTKLKR